MGGGGGVNIVKSYRMEDNLIEVSVTMVYSDMTYAVDLVLKVGIPKCPQRPLKSCMLWSF